MDAVLILITNKVIDIYIVKGQKNNNKQLCYDLLNGNNLFYDSLNNLKNQAIKDNNNVQT